MEGVRRRRRVRMRGGAQRGDEGGRGRGEGGRGRGIGRGEEGTRYPIRIVTVFLLLLQ